MTLVLTTPELRQGDIVLEHGMRCLLDSEPQLSKSHHGGNTFYCQALVLNRDEVPTSVVPYGFTADWKRNAKYEQVPHDGEHRWTIQGNERARWAVERP